MLNNTDCAGERNHIHENLKGSKINLSEVADTVGELKMGAGRKTGRCATDCVRLTYSKGNTAGNVKMPKRFLWHCRSAC